MKKMLFAVPLFVMGMLFSTTAMAHDGEAHGKEVYEEGSGGSAMEMDRKSRAMSHEYKEEHGGEHSKEHYEKKYGKYDHDKKHMMDSGKGMHEEGSGMKDEAMKRKEMEQKRMQEGSKM
jgi:hypothetical protein